MIKIKLLLVLAICATSTASANAQELVNDIAIKANRCNAAALNAVPASSLESWIADTLPSYCKSHSKAIYVGKPELEGFWVESAQYPQALKDYNARKALSDQDSNEGSQSGG